MGGFYFLKNKSGAGVSVDITDVLKTLGKVNEQSQRAIRAVVSDAKSRAPGWIRKAIRSDYTVESSEIKKALHIRKGQGQFELGGIMVDNVIFVYRGRTLTPIHFNMTPRSRDGRRRYNISLTIKTGRRQKLTGKSKWARPPFLAPSGRAGTVQIPFQRDKSLRDGTRLPIHAVKTLSVPQMIASRSEVKPSVEKAVSAGLQDRAWRQFKRFVLK